MSFPSSLWTYDRKMQLKEEQLTSFRPVTDILKSFDLKKRIPSDLIEKGDPLILENRYGMMFLIIFAREQGLITAAGPAMIARESNEKLRQRMQESGMNVSQTNQAMLVSSLLPVIPFSQMLQIGLMLHYALNHEKISSERIRFLSSLQKETGKEEPSLPKEHAGIWETEKKFRALIMAGSMDAHDFIRTMAVSSPGMHVKNRDPVRNAKNNAIVFLTIVSRAAIEGGLDPSLSYSLNDLYADRIEGTSSVAEVSTLIDHMLDDYLIRIQRAHTASGLSRRIQDACGYILLHIEEKLSIEEIADQEGYTPYYFSRLFHAETGSTVTAWIRHQKVLLARQMLQDTNLPVQEIAARLSFGSRSFFISAFRKETGMTPSAWRKDPYAEKK